MILGNVLCRWENEMFLVHCRVYKIRDRCDNMTQPHVNSQTHMDFVLLKGFYLLFNFFRDMIYGRVI